MGQSAFADPLGVHRTFLGSLERGERKTLQTLGNLALALDVDPLSLLSTPDEDETAEATP